MKNSVFTLWLEGNYLSATNDKCMFVYRKLDFGYLRVKFHLVVYTIFELLQGGYEEVMYGILDIISLLAWSCDT